ncbi:MAG: gamma-glutamyltransferase, partial [Zestosphaera sp.]
HRVYGGDTTYFAVVDSEGAIVSGIQSLFYPFGSKITEPTYGITLNSRASSFNLIPNHPNSLAPLKKPLHTLSAMIIVVRDREMGFGFHVCCRPLASLTSGLLSSEALSLVSTLSG